MPARIDVYCRAAEVRLDPTELRADLEAADLMTLAEALDLPASSAEFTNLRVVARQDIIEVYWKQDHRPIQLDVVSGPAARAHVAELVPALGSFGAQLEPTRSIVYLEMGLADSNDLAAALGEVLAFAIAERGDGLVRFYGREWASPADRAETIWTEHR